MPGNSNSPTARLIVVDERLNAVNKRLDAIEQAFSIRPTAPRVPWWMQQWNSIKKHKTTVTILITVVIGIVTVTATFGPRWLDKRDATFNDTVDRRVESILKSPNGVLETLGKIQTTTDETNATLKTLQPFIQDLIRHQFDAVSKLSSQDLSRRLPALGNLVLAANSYNVLIDSGITNNLAQKLLRVNSEAIGYWPTTGQLVNYRSSGFSGINQPALPDCADIKPSSSKLVGSISPGPQMVKTTGGTYENCIFTLDSKRDSDAVNDLVQHTFFVVFKHCRIVYRGGPIHILIGLDHATATLHIGGKNPEVVSATYSGPTLKFESCSFDFHLPTSPTPDVKAIAQSLLAQNGPMLELPRR